MLKDTNLNHNYKDLSINSQYLKKSKELKEIKKNFAAWASKLGELDNLSLAESLALLKKYDIRIPRILLPNVNLQLSWYRTRVISEESNEDLSNPQTFSYPPAILANCFQRANAPGFPVFYGAADGKTAMEELRINGQPVKAGDTIFLSKWRIKKDITFSFVNLTIPEIVEEHQLYAGLTRKISSEIERIFSTEDAFQKKEHVFMYYQASKLFLTGKHAQSGTIAHDIIYNSPIVEGIEINGILYPSVINGFRSMNCAIHPDFADKNLELESVQKVTFKEFTPDGSHVTNLYFGQPENGKITWKTLHSELKVYDFTIELELNTNWTQEKINGADFHFKGKKTNLRGFCAARVDRIDLSNMTVKQQDLPLYEKGTEINLLNDLKLDSGEAFLYSGSDSQEITLIRITIPLVLSMKEVTPTEVMQLKNER